MGALRALLEVARPGAHFQDARRIEAFLSFLGPKGSRGKQRFVDLDPRSGLPIRRSLTRLRSVQKVARDFFRAHRARPSAKASSFYAALAAVELPDASGLEARLVSRERGLSRFVVSADRVDGRGCLARHTFVFAQRGEAHVGLERGDLARPTEAFCLAVDRAVAGDAERAFTALAALEGVSVEEVVRGVIGPLQREGVEGPATVSPVLESLPGAAVLHLALERAGGTVGEDRCADPWSELDRSAEACARRSALGFRVAKERRLVCTPTADAPLRAALSAAGVSLVVRSR
ncbi:MAG: hypothetical protein HYZ28_05915 [Myxococcales bacterium]|nr:hypothetical protein [Myxococcales bacterium]